MTAAGIPSPPVHEIERLLGALTGVASARVVVDAAGHPEEIHVLADPALHPKQVVRNVESALNAAFGLDIDRRIISVAQVSAAAPAPMQHPNGGAKPAAQPVAASGAPAEPAEAVEDDEGRIVYVGLEATSRASRDVVCRVTVEHAGKRYDGSGEGPDTPQGRAEAAGRALFAALGSARGDHDLVLEGVTIVEAHGRELVLLAAHALMGRGSTPLVGTAPLGRSPEEAAVLAGLQATNRWSLRTDG